MAASLLNATKRSSKLLGNTFTRFAEVFMKPGGLNQGQQICRMSAKRTMKLMPTKYEWTLFKDHLHFHIALHAIPIGLIITYYNMTRGRCELRDIPEGYEPKYWEYFRHPIEQFIAWAFFRSYEESYERHLCEVNRQMIKRDIKKLKKKVAMLQARRNDYKGFYYIPVNPNPAYSNHELNKHPHAYPDEKF